LVARRVAGPFDAPPFDNFVVSPLGLVPKKESNKFRLIHDLSYPKLGETPSVNDGISPDDAAISYETFDVVVALIHRMGRGALLAKSDIESAFRIIPVHPVDRHLLGFASMVGFSSINVWPWVAALPVPSLKRLVRPYNGSRLEIIHSIAAVTHILDDFIFVSPGYGSTCGTEMEFIGPTVAQ
jgi:hypothetical protein